MRCPHCHGLRPATLKCLEEGKRAVFFIFVKDLRSSANNGCSECQLVFDALSTFKNEWTPNDDEHSVEIRAGAGLPLEVFYRREPLYLELFQDASLSRAAVLPETIGPITLVSEHSSSSKCTSLLTDWMRECSLEHEFCVGLDDDKPLPTRLLHISPDGTQVTLEESAGRKGRYIALSYCWGETGTHRALTTTTSTLESHKTGISISSLPQTIIDAITITRNQGFKYLWVDALCIIQDDATDWACEAASMCDVYSNASLTIIASRASGSSKGIFGPQHYHTFSQIPYCKTFINVRKALKREHGDLVVLEREPFTHEPINKRAWTLQENLLSNRAVAFTADEMRWRCNSWRKCECGMLCSLIEREDWFDMRAFLLPELFKAQTPSQAYRKWDEVVMIYTKRSLTHESDRLPALAGLARQFGGMMKACFEIDARYLAGSWDDYLPYSLLWKPESRSDLTGNIQRRRPVKWRAPSWSWVSLEVPVGISPNLGIEMLVDIPCTLDMTTQDFASVDQFLSLRIRGPFLDSLVSEPTNRRRFRTRLWSLKHNDIDIGEFGPDFEDLDGESTDEPFACAALLIGYRRVGRTYAALILQRSEEVYVRVGIADLGLVYRPPVGRASGLRGLVWEEGIEVDSLQLRADDKVERILKGAGVRDVVVV